MATTQLKFPGNVTLYIYICICLESLCLLFLVLAYCCHFCCNRHTTAATASILLPLGSTLLLHQKLLPVKFQPMRSEIFLFMCHQQTSTWIYQNCIFFRWKQMDKYRVWVIRRMRNSWADQPPPRLISPLNQSRVDRNSEAVEPPFCFCSSSFSVNMLVARFWKVSPAAEKDYGGQ